MANYPTNPFQQSMAESFANFHISMACGFRTVQCSTDPNDPQHRSCSPGLWVCVEVEGMVRRVKGSQAVKTGDESHLCCVSTQTK